MKHAIEIECPDGYKPIYKNGKIKLVRDNIIDQIKTYDDACKFLNITNGSTIPLNKSLESLKKLHIILDALNEGYEFDLLKGNVWYPYIKFSKSRPTDNIVVGKFSYKGEVYYLICCSALSGGNTGLTGWCSSIEMGFYNVGVGLLTCKSKEIAEYVSKQFGKLLFEACYMRHFTDNIIKWID